MSLGGAWWRLGPGIRHSAIRREALRISPVRPNASAGLRAGISTIGPLIVALFVPWPQLAVASLSGFSIVLADKGGAYRIRAKSMLAVGLGGALATFLGTLSGNHLLAMAVLLFVSVGAAGLLRMYGAAATSVGTVVAMAAIVSSTRPAADLMEALSYAQFYLLGALWASLLSLSLWPLRVYRPARLATAQALRQLGAFAASLHGATAEPEAQMARRTQIGSARAAIEFSRVQLGTIRRGRPGSTPRGERLLAVVEVADLLLGALVAIEDSLAFAPPRHTPHLLDWTGKVGEHVHGTLLAVAAGLEAEKPLHLPSTDIGELAHGLAWSAQNPDELELRILNRVLQRLTRLLEIARGVDEPGAVSPAHMPAAPGDTGESDSPWTRLREQLTLDSAIFRHALRSALSTVAVVVLVSLLGWQHGYWATLTCFVILQPHGTETWAKAVQRVLGSVLGAGAAVLVATWIGSPHWVIVWVFACVSLAVALLPLNYGAFTMLLTPAFVLLAETHVGDESLAMTRVVNTLVGALIALLGSRLLFPLSERDQIRPLLAHALATLSTLLQLVATPTPELERIRAGRRVLGLALLNAEASHQRLLTETGLDAQQADAVQTLLLYAHRMAAGLIAIAFAGGTAVHRELVAELPSLAAGLDELTEAFLEQRAPRPMQTPGEGLEDAARVQLLFDHLMVLRAASCRFLGQAAAVAE